MTTRSDTLFTRAQQHIPGGAASLLASATNKVHAALVEKTYV